MSSGNDDSQPSETATTPLSTQKRLSMLSSAVNRGIRKTMAPMNFKKVKPATKERFYLAHSRLSRMLKKAQVEMEDLPSPDVPPDTMLQNMDVICIRKVLKDVTVKQYYETIWSEGVRTKKQPFYGPWLSDGGKNQVNVQDWSFAKAGNEFVGWNNEKFPQKRLVDIQFIRTTHLYAGPPSIDVLHTQYCRNDGEDRCIVASKVEISGLPLCECFNVETRWVASRLGTNDLLIETGLTVVFVKAHILAPQIKAGAKEETIKGQKNLFESIALAFDAKVEDDKRALSYEAEEQKGVSPCSCSRLGDFLAGFFRPRGILVDCDDDVANGVREIDGKLQLIIASLEKSKGTKIEKESEVLDELSSANSSLEQVLAYLS